MGYYTNHEIFTDGDTDAILRELEKVSGYHSMTEDAIKWYDHEKDCRKVSKKFPKTLITVKGEGEESGDIWVAYFKNGKMQHSKAVIKLDDFDESKLK